MQDTNGVDLMPCDDPQDKYCGGAVPAPDPTQPPTFPDNFPNEFFYQQAGADSLVSAGGNPVLAEFDPGARSAPARSRPAIRWSSRASATRSSTASSPTPT